LALTEGLTVHALIAGMKLPDMTGVALVGALRARFPDLPVIFIGTATETKDLLAAIKLRPVDYLQKPLEWPAFKEALQRLAADVANTDKVVVQLGNGSYYCAHDGTLENAGQTRCLTGQERRLIETLIARRGQWIQTERLLMAVYADPDRATESGLKSLVMRLRRKIGREVIVSGYGLGYRLPLAQEQ
jgi:two-component system OmpR family response regulator